MGLTKCGRDPHGPIAEPLFQQIPDSVIAQEEGRPVLAWLGPLSRFSQRPHPALAQAGLRKARGVQCGRQSPRTSKEPEPGGGPVCV